jgi:hypothetical protein
VTAETETRAQEKSEECFHGDGLQA